MQGATGESVFLYRQPVETMQIGSPEGEKMSTDFMNDPGQ
jgi:hypothetical protein